MSHAHRAPFRIDREASGSSEQQTHSTKPYFGLGRSKLAPVGLRRHGGARGGQGWVRGMGGEQCSPRLAAGIGGGDGDKRQARTSSSSVSRAAAATAAAGVLRDSGGGLLEAGGMPQGWSKAAAARGRARKVCSARADLGRPQFGRGGGGGLLGRRSAGVVAEDPGRSTGMVQGGCSAEERLRKDLGQGSGWGLQAAGAAALWAAARDAATPG